jgi:hypothetical protein
MHPSKPSLSQIARGIQADVWEIASRLDHPKRKYRHAPNKAAMIVSASIGAPFSEEELTERECPHLSIQGHDRYCDDDLLEVARDILANAVAA